MFVKFILSPNGGLLDRVSSYKNIDHSKTTKNADGSTTYYDKDGYPDFSEHSKAEFKVEGMNGTDKDFSKIYKKMKDNYKFKSQNEVKKWLSEKGLTPHHHINGKTIQLIDKKIHDTFPHTGGASILRGN